MNKDIENFLASHPYAAETKATYRPILAELTTQPFESWEAADLVNFVTRPGWGNSHSYVALCACRKFICWKFGHTHPALTARIKRLKPKKQRALDLDKIIALLASFDTSTPQGARDLALAAVAIDTGLRESELARLKIADLDLTTQSLQVPIKGGEWGTGIYSEQTGLFVAQWLAWRTAKPGVDNLFVSLAHNKRRGDALTKHGIKAIFKRWGISLGWKLSPHDARRTFGNVATNLGAPQSVTMAAGRWHSETAFRRYTQEITARAITPYLPITNALKTGT